MNRSQFPLLKTAVYLDSAAGTLKPKSVVQAMEDFYLNYPINSRSDDSKLGQIVRSKITEARQLTATFLDATPEEVIFTSGTTDSLNKLAYMLTPLVHTNDEIILSYYNHGSGVVPFIELARRTGAKIIYSQDILSAITSKTKLVVLAQLNNTLFYDLPWEAIYNKVVSVGGYLINDAAQAVAHEKVSLRQAHAVVFSSNKLYGPTGCGALVIQKALLTKLRPVYYGSGSIASLSTKDYKLKPTIDQFEPGTLNIAGIIGLGAGIKYVNSLVGASAHERKVATYAYDQLKPLKNVEIYSRRGDTIILFNVKNVHSQDVVSYLGNRDIILRGGLHCAHLVNEVASFRESARLSVASYNDTSDIDKFITAMREGGNFVGFL